MSIYVRLADLFGKVRVRLRLGELVIPVVGAPEDAVAEAPEVGENVFANGKLFDPVALAFGFADPVRGLFPYQPNSFLLISSISLMSALPCR